MHWIIHQRYSQVILEFVVLVHIQFLRIKQSNIIDQKKILQYFTDNKENLIPVYLPTASPEFMVLEEIWHIAKMIYLFYSIIHPLLILKIKYLHIAEQKGSI